MAQPIRVDGLNVFVRNLRKLDRAVPKTMRVALNDCAEIVIGHARPKIPRRTGRAAASLQARSTATAVRVAAGGPRAPWYPWLDFGGRVGRRHSVVRPFIGEGRYIYPSLREKGAEFEAAMSRALLDAAQSAGVDVD